jgi:actin-like ATPase involved in cell morphogenesis
MRASSDPRFALGIDVGTSHTTAMLRWPDGHVRPLLFDGSPLLPSAVYAEPGGRLLVGRDAAHAARLDPVGFEPTPKRRVDHPTVHLGEDEIGVPSMLAAVLSRARDEAVRVSGGWIGEFAVTLTHPATWSVTRRLVLTRAADLAGLPEPVLLAEPVAAAAYLVEVMGHTVAPGSAIVVYDLGGGTFDASIVTVTADSGYELCAVDGLDHVGGADLDAALLDHVVQRYRDADPDAWRRLEKPTTAADRCHRRHLVENVRAAREALSRQRSAAVPVPHVDVAVNVTPDEFEDLARPVLARTLRTTDGVVGWAKLTPDRIGAVLLVGGCSRMPLVASLLRESLGVAPTTMEQPETAVAEGSVQFGRTEPVPVVETREAEPGYALGPPVRPPSLPLQRIGSEELAPPADPWAVADDHAMHEFALASVSTHRVSARYPVPTELRLSTVTDNLPAVVSPVLPLPVPRAPMARPPAPAQEAERGASRRRAAPRGPYLGTVVNTRSRLRWLRLGVALLLVVAVGAAAVLVGPHVVAGGL